VTPAQVSSTSLFIGGNEPVEMEVCAPLRAEDLKVTPKKNLSQICSGIDSLAVWNLGNFVSHKKDSLQFLAGNEKKKNPLQICGGIDYFVKFVVGNRNPLLQTSDSLPFLSEIERLSSTVAPKNNASRIWEGVRVCFAGDWENYNASQGSGAK